MYLVINKWVIAVNVSNFSGQYLRNHWTLDTSVLGYIGIVWPKEHSPKVWSVPPVTSCIYTNIHCCVYSGLSANIPQGSRWGGARWPKVWWQIYRHGLSDSYHVPIWWPCGLDCQYKLYRQYNVLTTKTTIFSTWRTDCTKVCESVQERNELYLWHTVLTC